MKFLRTPFYRTPQTTASVNLHEYNNLRKKFFSPLIFPFFYESHRIFKTSYILNLSLPVTRTVGEENPHFSPLPTPWVTKES